MTLPLPDGCAPDCKLSHQLLAQKFGCIAFAAAQPLPGNGAAVSETSRQNSCGMVRGCYATVLQDFYDSLANYWRAAKA
jgi:hypothetical protein